MTVPPNALAAAGIALGAWLAARTGRRAPLIIGSAVIGIIGTSPSLVQRNRRVLTGTDLL